VFKNQWISLSDKEFQRVRSGAPLKDRHTPGHVYILTGSHLWEGIIKADGREVEILGDEDYLLGGVWTIDQEEGLLVGKYYESDVIPDCCHAIVGKIPDKVVIEGCDEIEDEDEVALFKRADHLLWVYGEDK